MSDVAFEKSENRMRRVFAILGSGLFLLLAPGTAAGVVPWWISRWQVQPPLLRIPVLRLVGGFLIIASICLVLDSFARFAIQGLGTPAPVFPTRHLVISGLYRHVRNPIYIAVVVAILGQGLLFGSVPVLEYGVLVWLAFHVFVLVYEEPKLTATFGPEYEVFCAHVPRWLARLRPWQGRGMYGKFPRTAAFPRRMLS